MIASDVWEEVPQCYKSVLRSEQETVVAIYEVLAVKPRVSLGNSKLYSLFRQERLDLLFQHLFLLWSDYRG